MWKSDCCCDTPDEKGANHRWLGQLGHLKAMFATEQTNKVLVAHSWSMFQFHSIPSELLNIQTPDGEIEGIARPSPTIHRE